MNTLKKLWTFLFALRPVIIPALVFGVEMMLWVNLMSSEARARSEGLLTGLAVIILFGLVFTAVAFFNPEENDTLLAAAGSAVPLLLSAVVAGLAYATMSGLPWNEAGWVRATLMASFIGQTMMTVWLLSISSPSDDGPGSGSSGADAPTVTSFCSTHSSDSCGHSGGDGSCH